jgi:hypothetical protein
MPEGQGTNNNERMKLDLRIGSSYKMVSAQIVIL